MTLYGPEEVLADIEALPEVEVDITEITEDQTVDVDLPVPQGVTKIDPQTIKVQIDVDEVGEESEASTEESSEDNSS